MVGQASGFANVNFDYNGPPVLVTNGMTLDLVVQFGIQNAYYAYLKLRGLNSSANETEKATALKHFRNKIRVLKRSAESLRDQNTNDYNVFLNKEFNGVSNELATIDVTTTENNSSTNSNSSISKNLNNAEAVTSKPTTKSDGENATLDESKKNNLNEDKPGNLVIDEEVSVSTNAELVKKSLTSVFEKLKLSASSTHSINSICSTSVTTTAPSLMSKAASNIDSPTSTSISDLNGNALVESLISKRHQETIDNVVSTVIEKIRNNMPFDNESSILAFSSSTASNSNQLPAFLTGNLTRSLQATKNRNNKTKNLIKQTNISPIEQISIDEEGKVTSTAQPQQNQQQILVSNSHIMPATTTLLDGTTAAIVATLPTSHEQLALNALRANATSSSASSALHQSLGLDQVTILSNFTEIIRASTSSQPTNISQFTPVTKVLTHSCQNELSTQRLQQQQQQHLCTQIPLGTNIQIPSFSVPFSANTNEIPIRISPQNTITLPNNITVQSLLQSLQQKTKKQQQFLQLTQLQLGQLQQNQPIQLQIQPTGNFQHTPQQILPDSSSQEPGNANQIQISHAQPSNILSLSENIDIKIPKKRQYVKRKNVTSSNIFLNNEMSVKDSVLAAIGKTGIVSLEKILSTQPNLSCKNENPNNLSDSTVNATLPTNFESKDVNALASNLKSLNSAKKLTISPATTTKKDEKTDTNEFELYKEQLKLPKTTTKTTKKNKTLKSLKKINLKKLPKTKAFKIVSKNLNEPNAKLLKQPKSELISTVSKEKNAQKVMELEKELAKCKKQLTTEKNKFLAQKKRIEKLLADIEKNSDVVQLAQIDLACQKTDNNNLIAENIALKAELQKLKAKESKENLKLVSHASKTSERKTKNSINLTLSKEAAKSNKIGRKRLNNLSTITPSTSYINQQKQEKLVSDMSVEYGRRQSKRICVARKNFLTLLY